MKKLVSAIGLSLALTAALPLTALAHGHGGAAKPTITLCSVTDCHIVANHYHDSVLCAGHSIGDGHDYHQICTVKNCTKTSSHDHKGVTCLPHTVGDGHSYHKSGNHHR
jgi:hypothetical protein